MQTIKGSSYPHYKLQTVDLSSPDVFFCPILQQCRARHNIWRYRECSGYKSGLPAAFVRSTVWLKSFWAGQSDCATAKELATQLCSFLEPCPHVKVRRTTGHKTFFFFFKYVNHHKFWACWKLCLMWTMPQTKQKKTRRLSDLSSLLENSLGWGFTNFSLNKMICVLNLSKHVFVNSWLNWIEAR